VQRKQLFLRKNMIYATHAIAYFFLKTMHSFASILS